MDCFVSWLTYISQPFLDDVRRLRETSLKLRCERDDLLRIVEIREAQGFRRTSQVACWLESVDELEARVTSFLASLEDRTYCFGSLCFPGVLSTSHRLEKEAEVLSERAQDFAEISAQSEKAVDKGLEIPSSEIVGMEETLTEIHRSLRENGDSTARIVGICGMGGCGKTALLRSVYNRFVTSSKEFDLVVWVTVSRDSGTERLQWDIASQLGLRVPNDEEEAAKVLLQAFRPKKFLIILDDVWEAFHLEKIGIPLPRNHSSIVFATRSISVCHNMRAHRIIKVPLLSEDSAWELFRRELRSEAALENEEIRHYARQLVSLCGGLPLALITVARAMAYQGLDASAWRGAVKAMSSSGSHMRGFSMVLDVLKFSFDSLASDVMRECLLYCSLFPRCFEIDREQLIDYWLGEGFLDDDGGCGDLDAARDRGHSLIDQLMAASLLQNGSEGERRVILHDLVREMLISEQRGLSVMQAGSDLTRFPKVGKWSEIRRVSLMMNKVRELHPMPSCPHLLTLLLDHNEGISMFPEGFFNKMSTLRVLNLSHTSITELPAEIGLLLELRYLNLSFTPLRSLPMELGNLVRLRHLGLSYTDRHLKVPRRVLSRLSSLQVLSMEGSGIEGRHDRDESADDDDDDIQITLGDLEMLKELQDLRLTIATDSSLERFLDSRSLRRRTRVLRLEGVSCKSIHLTATPRDMVKLRHLALGSCCQLEELVLDAWGQQVLRLFELGVLQTIVWDRTLEPREDVHLRRLVIDGCSRLRNVTWILQLENLEEIYLTSCTGLEEVIADGDDHEIVEQQVQSALCRLRVMELKNLPRLRSIRRQVLALPSLEHLSVADCPMLRRLPFGKRSALNLREILADGHWWGALEWEEGNVESVFLPKLRMD